MNQHDGEEIYLRSGGILTVYLDGSEYCLNRATASRSTPRPADWVNQQTVVKIHDRTLAESVCSWE